MDQQVKGVFAEWEGSGNRESSELGSGVVAFGKLIQYDGNDSVKNNAPRMPEKGGREVCATISVFFILLPGADYTGTASVKSPSKMGSL